MIDALGIRTLICGWLDKIIYCGCPKALVKLQLQAIKNYVDDKMKEIEALK
jgi:hypothetical protein